MREFDGQNNVMHASHEQGVKLFLGITEAGAPQPLKEEACSHPVRWSPPTNYAIARCGHQDGKTSNNVTHPVPYQPVQAQRQLRPEQQRYEASCSSIKVKGKPAISVWGMVIQRGSWTTAADCLFLLNTTRSSS